MVWKQLLSGGRATAASAVVMSVAVSMATSAMAESVHGTLSYGSGAGDTAIDFMPASGSPAWQGDIGSTNFVYENFDVSADPGVTGSWLTLGLQASAHFGNPDGPTYVGNNTYRVNRGSGYTGGAGSYPNSPKWGFQWNVTVDGARPTTNEIFYSLRVTGPGGDYGTLLGGIDASGTFDGDGTNGVIPVFQGSNNLGFQAYSDPGPDLGAGPLWSGLSFDPDELGTYSFTLIAWAGNPSGSGTVIGTTSMSVEVVPGAGSIAGLAAIGGIRRRRRR
jgi:hypothetical protein